MVILDTNIIIDHLRQSTPVGSVLSRISETNEKLAISIITLQELFAGKSTRDKNVEKLILDMLSTIKILPYNEEIAKLAGLIVRDLGRLIQFPDAAIAATAIDSKAKFLTLNKKDFESIPGLTLYE